MGSGDTPSLPSSQVNTSDDSGAPVSTNLRINYEALMPILPVPGPQAPPHTPQALVTPEKRHRAQYAYIFDMLSRAMRPQAPTGAVRES